MKAKNQGRVPRGTATTCALFLILAMLATSESAQAANLNVNCDNKRRFTRPSSFWRRSIRRDRIR
jgi:hypothetical protein